MHLAAQSAKVESDVSLLDRKLDECTERELLELKVAARRKIADWVAKLYEVGSPTGGVVRLADSHAQLAAAEIELYRYTGERGKLRIALQSRVEALTDKLRALTNAYDATAIQVNVLCEAEIELLDALLEQKREDRLPQITATNPQNGAKNVDEQ